MDYCENYGTEVFVAVWLGRGRAQRDETSRQTPYDGGRASAGSLRGRSRRQILQSTAFYTNTGVVEWLAD
jgi:hypothetical protein